MSGFGVAAPAQQNQAFSSGFSQPANNMNSGFGSFNQAPQPSAANSGFGSFQQA